MKEHRSDLTKDVLYKTNVYIKVERRRFLLFWEGKCKTFGETMRKRNKNLKENQR